MTFRRRQPLTLNSHFVQIVYKQTESAPCLSSQSTASLNPSIFVDGIKGGLLSALLIIGSPAFVVRPRFKESLTSTYRSRRIPNAHECLRIVLG
jgi:hypothetical protein